MPKPIYRKKLTSKLVWGTGKTTTGKRVRRYIEKKTKKKKNDK